MDLSKHDLDNLISVLEWSCRALPSASDPRATSDPRLAGKAISLLAKAKKHRWNAYKDLTPEEKAARDTAIAEGRVKVALPPAKATRAGYISSLKALSTESLLSHLGLNK
jgi:hypothetical protein